MLCWAWRDTGLEDITGMLLSSLVNTEKRCSPSASALDVGVVFKLLLISSGATD